MGKLNGQVAIVTGGGRGIGRAIAPALAADGAAVAVTSRSADQLAETVVQIETAGGRALAVAGDAAELPTAMRTVAAVEQVFGPVDVLVNNAAMLGPDAPIAEVDPDAWWRALAVNVYGPFVWVKAVLPGMLVRRRGRIINVASGGGLLPLPGLSGYGVSKTALIRFSETLAAETCEHGLAVFSIYPGDVRTAMAAEVAAPARAKPCIRVSATTLTGTSVSLSMPPPECVWHWLPGLPTRSAAAS